MNATVGTPQQSPAYESKPARITAAPAAEQGKKRSLWYRLRLTVQEMNYATRRMNELRMRLP